MQTPLRNDILRSAFKNRYGVASFNVFNDTCMEAVLESAKQLRAPVIVGVAAKTAKQWGPRLLQTMFSELVSQKNVTAILHLDHCSDISLIKECITAGWNSVLYDATGLGFEDNLQKTREVVIFAHEHGATVEGELEAIEGMEDGYGHEREGEKIPLEQCIRFIEQTSIDSFAPAIGTVHGVYEKAPVIDYDRVSRIVEKHPIPIVLHGGTGLDNEVFRKLITLGCCKINISTLLKMTFFESVKDHIQTNPKDSDPYNLLMRTRTDLITAAKQMINLFGGTNKA